MGFYFKKERMTKMYNKSLESEVLTKQTQFEDIFQSIAPMIHHIAAQADGVYGLEIDDVKQELAIQAYYAWEKWEPGRGAKFSTYVFDVLVNKKNHLIRMAKAQKRNCGLAPASLDESIDSQGAGGDSLCLYDVLADTNQDPEEGTVVLELWDVVESVLASMQEKGQRVIRALLNGYTQMETGRFTGISQPLVSYYLKTFRVKMSAELGRRGLM